MFSALLFTTGVLIGTLLTYGMVTALIVYLVVWLIQAGYAGLGFWKNVAVMSHLVANRPCFKLGYLGEAALR